MANKEHLERDIFGNLLDEAKMPNLKRDIANLRQKELRDEYVRHEYELTHLTQ